MPGSPPLVEHVYFNPPALQEADSWWARYKAQLTGLTETARASVEADSRYILQRGILAADTAKPEDWSFRRSRTGLVMGSVQSGKTASMLGVSALAIDNGLDIIVVLALMLPLFCGVLSSLLTRLFCAVPRTSVSRIAWG